MNLQQRSILKANDYQHFTAAEYDMVRFINEIITHCIAKHASDIHFEPYEKYYRIRARIDGILHQIMKTDTKLAPRFSSRLKVMAALDIAEKRLPQDGRCKFKLDNHKSINLRINSCPTLCGEKIVLRLLDDAKVQLDIETLTLSDTQQQLFLQALHKSQGMILVTGPTGSGKTVTLYTALHLLNNVEKNISTVEDPIEIYLPGINQVNINNKAGLNFSTTLRALLRQDPDVIMLGEIRDLETAEISIRAAQTGHLVLSTLHTNNTVETLIRLRNMGVAVFNIATSINLVIAQRLLRCLCSNCKQPDKINKNILLQQGFSAEELPSLQLYRAVGCKNCSAGYAGRTAIFEFLPLTAEIREAILCGANSLQIQQQAEKLEMLNLQQAALIKARQGITSLTEINRVIS